MKFAAACASFIVAASAQHHGGHGGFGGYGGGYGGGHGGPRGYDSGRGGQRTYGWKKDVGYGIYNFQAHSKPLIGGDGYKLKKRSDPYESVTAKCVLNDPDEETYITGLLWLSQAAGDNKTKIWGSIQSANHADIAIHALGDLRDGCDSTGPVFNPYVSQHGTASYHKEQYNQKAPGELGTVGHGKIDQWANVDLSGTHSIVGRSVAVSVPKSDKRIACCTIGLAASPKQAYGGGHGRGGYGYGNQGGHY